LIKQISAKKKQREVKFREGHQRKKTYHVRNEASFFFPERNKEKEERLKDTS
jgi:hypothetical protein